MLIILSETVSAMSLDYFENVMDIGENSVHYRLSLLFSKSPDGEIHLPLFYKIKNFKHTANFGNYTCEKNDESWGTDVFCRFMGSNGTGRTLYLEYDTSDDTLLKRVDGKYVFKSSVKSPLETKKMVVTARLSEGFVLIDPNDRSVSLPPYSPESGKKSSDGRRIYVIWERADVEKGDGIDISVVFERMRGRGGIDPLYFFGAGIIVLGFLFILILRGMRNSEIPTMILREDEKKVIDILKEHGNSCKQKVIVDESGYSKAKVSRLVSDLEARGLLKVERRGRTNILTLLTPKD